MHTYFHSSSKGILSKFLKFFFFFFILALWKVCVVESRDDFNLDFIVLEILVNHQYFNY